MNNQIVRTYENMEVFPELVGNEHRNIRVVEDYFGVEIFVRGNVFTFQGYQSAKAAKFFDMLYSYLSTANVIDSHKLYDLLKIASTNKETSEDLKIITKRKIIISKTSSQRDFIRRIDNTVNNIIFGIGPAGTGKTYLAVAKAVEYFLQGMVDRIILSRPAVEAGEHLGFLPGSMQDKVDPYLRPYYDALFEMMPAETVKNLMDSGEIEIAPLAFMRGRTLSRSFVILDEAQNATMPQLKMFLTRLGEESKMVITGDLTQTDLPSSMASGLKKVVNILKDVPGIDFTFFNDDDIVRSFAVQAIIEAFRKYE